MELQIQGSEFSSRPGSRCIQLKSVTMNNLGQAKSIGYTNGWFLLQVRIFGTLKKGVKADDYMTRISKTCEVALG